MHQHTKILLKSVQILCDIIIYSIFQMATGHDVKFLRLKNFIRWCQRAETWHCAKFRQNGVNPLQIYCDILIFQNGCCCHFGFSNSQNFIGWRGPESRVHYCAVFLLQRYFSISRQWPSTILDSFGAYFGHPWKYLVVSITVQNLCMTNAAVWTIWTFQYLEHMARKSLNLSGL